jgi:hypothetical protein
MDGHGIVELTGLVEVPICVVASGGTPPDVRVVGVRLPTKQSVAGTNALYFRAS